MTNELHEKYVKMTETPVEKLVLKLALPAIISMLITAIYNMADTYFVGQVGTSATAAVGVAFPLMSLIQAVSFFFGHGAGNSISRKLGAEDDKDALKMASTGFYSSVAFGIVIAILGIIFIYPLSVFLGATDTMLSYSKGYLLFILLGAPFISGSFVMNNLLRFQGNAFYGMIGMASGAILNIVLDPVFIFGFNMDVKGAGLATLISQITGFAILFFINNKKGIVKIKLKNFDFNKNRYLEIVKGGLPSFARQGLNAISVIVLNNIASAYGDAAIAAMSIVSRIGMIVMSATIGFGQGFQPVCGYNYGAKKYDRVQKAFRFTLLFTFCILTLGGIICFLFSEQIITAFRKDADVIKIGSYALRLHTLTYPFLSYSVMSNMFLQTIGKSVSATITAMSRQFMFFLPVLIVLENLYGITGIQCTQPIADLLSIILAIPLTQSVLKKMKHKV